MLRFYDREERDAFTLPARPSPREQPEQRTRREEIGADPHRFIGIEPIAFDTQLGWMHGFTEEQPSPIREQLQLALASSRPARDFASVVRAAPALNDAWHRDLLREVTRVIEQWAQKHTVDVDIYVPTATPRAGSDGGRPRMAAGSALRAALHRAIDRMPEHELMALSLPVGYLIETRERG